MKGEVAMEKAVCCEENQNKKVGRKAKRTREVNWTSQEEEVLKFWNEKQIIRHQKEKIGLNRKIKNALKKYSLSLIQECIKRYNEVIKSEYFFSHKWSLGTFLTDEHIQKFMDDGERWVGYLEWKQKQSTAENEQSPVVIVKEKPKKERIVVEKPKVDDFSVLYTSVINKLKSMPYDEYLKTEHWKRFSNEAVKFARYRCELCNKDHVRLNVHHKTYENRGRETFNDVIVLCDECHAMVHGK